MPFQTAGLLEKNGRRLRLLDFGMVALAMLSLVLAAAAVATFYSVKDRQAALNASVREDAVWAAYQVDSETKKLLLSLALLRQSPGPVQIGETSLRYDILYSRTDLLTGASYARKFGRIVGLEQAASDVRARVLSLAGDFDALSREGSVTAGAQDRLMSLLSAVTQLAGMTEKLLNRANLAQLSLRVEEREAAGEAFTRLAQVVGALIGTMALIVAFLGYQLAQIKRSRNTLAALGLERAEAAARAEAALRAKSIFLATMSHEIRTPLNGIIGSVDLLQHSDMDAEQHRKLGVVAECSNTLLALIDDILDFTKLEAGTLEFEAVPTDVSRLIRSVVDAFRDKAAAKDICLEINSPPKLAIASDPTRLRQILFNLIGNAVKFTPSGRVEIECALERERLKICVRDTGIGIDETMRDRLFKDFSQVDVTINRRFGGTGLGLAICDRIVRGLGGEIGADRIDPRGSCFWFEIPARLLQQEPADAHLLATERGTALSGSVLLAEDNDINRAVASEMLRLLSLSVTAARDGSEAVDLASATPFDVILMDMQMPGTDGLTATQTLRAKGYGGAIIALTSNAMSSDRQACLAAGMDDFIAKPINRAKLEAALRPWLTCDRPKPDPIETNSYTLQIDEDQRNALIGDLGLGVVEGLTAQFRIDAPQMLTRAGENLDMGHLDQARRDIHTLKGVAATLGFAQIAATARVAELALLNGTACNLHSLQSLVDQACRADQRAKGENFSLIHA